MVLNGIECFSFRVKESTGLIARKTGFDTFSDDFVEMAINALLENSL